jgi:hypothetical protein
MPVVKCPDCGKVVSTRFTIHNCKIPYGKDLTKGTGCRSPMPTTAPGDSSSGTIQRFTTKTAGAAGRSLLGQVSICY